MSNPGELACANSGRTLLCSDACTLDSTFIDIELENTFVACTSGVPLPVIR